MLRWSLQIHKWIALIVGLQVLGWVLGGLVMTAIPIERVHGDNHVAVSALPAVDLKRVVPLEKQLALAEATDVATATLKNTPRGPIWVVKSAAGSEGWWNAYSGANIDEMGARDARRFALMSYKGPGRLTGWHIKRLHRRKHKLVVLFGKPASATRSTRDFTSIASLARFSAAAQTFGTCTTYFTRYTS